VFSIKSIASFILTLIVCSLAAAFGGRDSASDAILDKSIIENFKQYDGKIIGKTNIIGLRRTHERALLWIMKSTQGQIFSAEQLAKDKQIIENTGNLYDIFPSVKLSQDRTDQVDITIDLRDKWTLLPVFGSQGGGGSITYGGGVVESNLAGYLVNAQAIGYNYNGIFSYDLNFNQEYVAGTQTMAYVDWVNSINPTIIHNIDGSSAGNFTWQRQQEEFMVGTHLDGPIRLMLIGDLYYDNLLLVNAVNVSTFSGSQYRAQPTVILGRSNIQGFLENGHELTFHTTAANFLGPVQAYQGIDGSFKKVYLLPHEGNFAYFIFAGGMSLAPPPYEYEVGGYANIRGYITDRQVGPYISYANMEYRPLLFKYRFSAPYIDLVAVQGCVFTDAGSAWGDSTLTGDQASKNINLLWSAGLGFRANFLHFAGAIIRMDLARTLHPDEGLGLSFGVGQFF